MIQDIVYPHYVTNIATVGSDFQPESNEAHFRVRLYLDALTTTYAEMSNNDSYKGDVYREILAISDYLKRVGK